MPQSGEATAAMQEVMPAGGPLSVNRWTPLVAGMYLELCGGSVYITSLYAAALTPAAS